MSKDDRDHRALDRHHVQKRWNGDNLVRLRLDHRLRQHEALSRREGRDHVDGGPRRRLSPGSAQGLAVNGDDFHRRLRQRRHPIDKATLERVGIERGENIAQRVMRRRAVGERRKPTQQRQLLFAEPLDIGEAFRPGQHAKERHQQYLVQRIDDLARLPRVRQITEIT